MMTFMLLLEFSLSAQMTVSINYNVANCPTGNNGTANAQATGGTPPYTYQWSSGENWQSIANVGAGNLSVTVTDANWNTGTASVYVNVPDPLEISISGGDYDCWSDNNTMTAMVNGGSAPFNFNWSTGASGQTVTLTEPDYIFVTVTDSKGCVKVAGKAYIEPMALQVNSIDGACWGSCDGSIEVDVEGGIAPYFFKWDNGFQPSSQIQSLAPFGDYNVTVTDGMGCTKVAFGSVHEPPEIQIDVDLANPCSDGTAAQANISGGTPPYNITWTNGTDGPHAYLTTGSWFVKVVDANNCPMEKEIEIIGGEDLNIQVSATNADCTSGNGTATALVVGGNSTYTYEWENGQTGATATGLTPGDYKVTVTDQAGCSGLASVTIEESDPIELSANATASGCYGDNGTATVQPVGGSGNYYFKWNDPLNQGGQTAYQLPPGTYTVTVTDEAGCTNTMEVEIPDESIEVVVDITNASCDDVPTGKLNASILSGGTAPFTYKWSNGATTTNLDGVAAGWYGVTVTDAEGCTEEMTVEVEDESMQVSIEMMNQGCPGTSQGALQTIVQNGIPPYNIQWSNGTQSQAIGSLSDGYYSVVVTDAAGCEKEVGYQLQTPEMELVMDMTHSSCDDINNGTAQVAIANGGMAPFTYAWSNGANTESLSNLSAGTYEVVVTDANGCTQTTSIEIEDKPFEVIVNVTNANCENSADGFADVDITNGGLPPYQYSWSNGSNEVNTTDLGPGQYSVIVTDATGCSQEAPFEIIPNATIEAAFDYEVVDCTEDGIVVEFKDLSAQNGTNATAWQWNLSTTQSSNQQNPTFLITDENVTAELTITNPEGCTDVIAQDFQLETINYSLEPAYEVCQTAYHELNLDVSNSNVTIDWAPDNLILSGDGTTNPVFSTADVGTFTVEVTMENTYGCIITDQVQITVEEAASIDPASFSFKQCSHLTVDFEVSGSVSDYVWFFDYPNNPTATASGTTATFDYPAQGTYTVAVEPVGECAETQYLTVEVGEGAIADFTADISECENPVQIQFNDNSFVPNGNVVSYSWDFGANGTSNEPNPSLTIDADQNVEASLTIEFGDGCTVTVEQNYDVAMFNPPSVVNQHFTCAAGEEVELNPGGDPNFTYQWSPSSLVNDPTAANPIATVNGTTTFNVVITDPITNCSTTEQVLLELPASALALLPLEDVTSCDFEQVTLVAEANMDVDIIWSLDPNFSTTYTTDSEIVVTPGNAPVTFYVQATTQDGCVATEEVTVSNFDTGLSFDNAFKVCEGQMFEVEFPNVNPESDFTAWSPYNPYTNPINTSTQFSFEFSNGFGCEGTGSFHVQIMEFPEELAIEVDPDGVFPGETAQLAVNYNENFTYNWSPNQTLTNGHVFNPIARPLQTTTYTVEVTDEETGCRDSEQVTVNVKESVCEEPYLYIPNAFTPNKDGVNDVLYVRGENIDEVYMTIYNRWGEKVFETESLNEGWDGTFNGKTVSGDVYGYYLKIICYGGREFFKKGNVTVLR
jgi:gliding motility-associated-like protein